MPIISKKISLGTIIRSFFIVALFCSGCASIMERSIESLVGRVFETEEQRHVRKDMERLGKGEVLKHHKDKYDLYAHDSYLKKRKDMPHWYPENGYWVQENIMEYRDRQNKIKEAEKQYEIYQKNKEPVIINLDDGRKIEIK